MARLQRVEAITGVEKVDRKRGTSAVRAVDVESTKDGGRKEKKKSEKDWKKPPKEDKKLVGHEEVGETISVDRDNLKESKEREKKRKDTSNAGTEGSETVKRRKASPSPDNTAEAPKGISESVDENEALSKHPSIFKKFQAILRSKQSASSTTPTEVSIPTTLPDELRPQGLHPLPQPVDSKRTKSQLPLDSTLPSWLSEPTVIPPYHSLPFSDLPISEKLQNRITNSLKFERAFAVQAAVLPLLLAGPTDPKFHTYHDVLVSAPTGSGKTLSYILPIVQNLSQRTVTRMRAVIIVPTRELVSQVRDTTESLASGLKVGIAWGARSLELERSLLVKDNWGGDSGRPDVFDEQFGNMGRYSSKVDILICTPGRLVEHLTTTPGFHLNDLKWMVIDEADRLLAQSFQDWLGAVMKGLQTQPSKFDSKAQEITHALGLRRNDSERVRKVVLSATMTKDAGKLAGLKLRKPRLVVIEQEAAEEASDEDQDMTGTISPDVDKEDEEDEGDEDDKDDKPDEIFSVPSTLSENYVSVAEMEDKPLYLVQLLQTQGIRSGALVFTKSNESAARLSRLMNLMVEGLRIGLVSGELNKSGRKRIMAEFKRNEIDV